MANLRTHYIHYPEVHGYATFERALKRGQEVAEKLDGIHCNGSGHVSWMVVPGKPGRWVPTFNVSNIPGGPGMLLNEKNVCTFN